MFILHTFNGRDTGKQHYVLFNSPTIGTRLLQNAGIVGDDFYASYVLPAVAIGGNGSASFPYKGDYWSLSATAPTMQEYGTTDEMSFDYRTAVGIHPATFIEMQEAKRIHILDMTQVLKAVEFAGKVGALDALYNGLSRLACRDDATIVLGNDMAPYSFFWWQVPREEHEAELDRMSSTYKGEYTMSARGRYHGALVWHRDHSGKTPGSWSTHT